MPAKVISITIGRAHPVVFVLLSWLGLSPCAAQPTINSLDAPQPGYSAIMHQRWTYSGLWQQLVITSGPDAEWNLFPIINDTLIPIVFSDPSSLSSGIAFPSASVAIQASAADPVQFDSVSTGATFMLGTWTSADSIRQLAEPMLSMVYPCSVGTSWRDTSDWSEPLTGAMGYRSISDTADGYGHVLLPWGTVYDVLSLLETETWCMITGGDSERVVTTRRRFLKPGFPVDLVQAWTTLHFAPGNNVGTYAGSGARFLDELYFMGTQDPLRTTDHALVLSSPFEDELRWSGGPMHGRYSLLDAGGRSVMSGTIPNSHTVMTQGLSSAVYCLTLWPSDGSRPQALTYLR